MDADLYQTLQLHFAACCGKSLGVAALLAIFWRMKI